MVLFLFTPSFSIEFSMYSSDFPVSNIKSFPVNYTIIFGPQPHLYSNLSCEQLEEERTIDPRGVVPPALTPTAQLSPMQFRAPPKESRTAVAARAASACPTATAWIICSRLRFGEAHAPIGRGAPQTAPKYVLVCTMFPRMGECACSITGWVVRSGLLSLVLLTFSVEKPVVTSTKMFVCPFGVQAPQPPRSIVAAMPIQHR